MVKPKKKSFYLARGKVITAVLLSVAGLIVVAGGIFYLVYVLKPTPQPAAPGNQFAAAVNELLGQPVPDDPISRAVFYALVAQNYDNLNEPTNALSYYLKAQQVVDDHHLSDQIVYYQPIADDYLAKKDVVNARKYLLLQKAHVQAFLQANPGDEPSRAAIKELDRRLDELTEP